MNVIGFIIIFQIEKPGAPGISNHSTNTKEYNILTQVPVWRIRFQSISNGLMTGIIELPS